jgi:PadR family transcriptional regulator AphA
MALKEFNFTLYSFLFTIYRWLRQDLEAGYKEDFNMGYWVKENNGRKYIECIPEQRTILSEQDALDLIGICGEQDTNLLMLHSGNLPEAFFDLKTGLAGAIMQKFENYRIKAVAVLPSELVSRGRFREFALEANRGSQFRIFDNQQEAEAWLTGDK